MKSRTRHLRLAALAALLAGSNAACGGAPSAGDRAASGKPAAKRAPGPGDGAGGPRYVLGGGDNVFWAARTPDGGDRVVVGSSGSSGSGGTRVETDARGVITKTAWLDGADGGDVLRTAFAVPERLGGGFVHLSTDRAFWSREFTGPLEAIRVPGSPRFRGARVGESGMVLLGTTGGYEISVASKSVVRGVAAPSVDAVELPSGRGARIDPLGRVYLLEPVATGARVPVEIFPSVSGNYGRGLSVEDDLIVVTTNQGRFVIESAAQVRSVGYAPYGGSSQTDYFAGATPRPSMNSARYGGYSTQAYTALQQALVSGAVASDGSAYAPMTRGLVRLDVATGRVIEEINDGVLTRFNCSAASAAKGAVLLCESNYGGGGYSSASTFVLAVEPGPKPSGAGRASGAIKLERSFTGSGSFVGDDDGALGFTGGCDDAEPEPEDPYGSSRYRPYYGGYGSEQRLGDTLCVRTAKGDWVARTAQLEPGETIIAWIPKLDGTAVALTTRAASQSATEAKTTRRPRVRVGGGVRIVNTVSEWSPLSWSSVTTRSRYYGSRYNYSYGQGRTQIDRSYHANDDGSVDGWLTTETGGYSSYGSSAPAVTVGVSIDANGNARRHSLPDEIVGETTTGRFGIAVSRKGDVYETTDHGATWSRAGTWPLQPAELRGACSKLGCAVEGVARVGWGTGAPVEIRSDKPPPRAEVASSRIALVCSPVGDRRMFPRPSPDDAQTSQVYSRSYSSALASSVVIEKIPLPLPPPKPKPKPKAPVTPPPSSVGGYGYGYGGDEYVPPPVLKYKWALVWRAPFDALSPPRRTVIDGAATVENGVNRVVPVVDGADVNLLLVYPPAGDPDGYYSGYSRYGTPPVNPKMPDPGGGLLLSAKGARRLQSGEPSYRYGGTSAVRSGAFVVDGGRVIALADFQQKLVLEQYADKGSLPFVAIGSSEDTQATTVLVRRDDGALGVAAFDATPASGASVALVDATAGTVGLFEPVAPLGAGACKPEPGDFAGVVPVDADGVFDLDAKELPRTTLGSSGFLRVRFGKARSCIEAVDLAASGRGDSVAYLAARFDAGTGKGKGGLGGGQSVQELACALRAPAPGVELEPKKP